MNDLRGQTFLIFVLILSCDEARTPIFQVSCANFFVRPLHDSKIAHFSSHDWQSTQGDQTLFFSHPHFQILWTSLLFHSCRDGCHRCQNLDSYCIIEYPSQNLLLYTNFQLGTQMRSVYCHRNIFQQSKSILMRAQRLHQELSMQFFLNYDSI